MPILFIIALIVASLMVPYSIVYKSGPLRPGHFTYNNPRRKLLLFLSILAVEIAVIYIGWRLKNY